MDQHSQPAPSLKVLFLKKRFGHHTKSGGYDAIAQYIASASLHRPEMSSLLGRIAALVWRKTHEKSLVHPRYHLGDRLVEEMALCLSWIRRTDIVHALYGDEQIDILLRRISWLHGKLVVTFHLPVDQVREIFDKFPARTLRKLGGVVIVGSRDATALGEWLGSDKIFFVPHGIDTTQFTPALAPPVSGPEKPARFAFVGWHMRDFDMAHAAIDQCREAGLNAEFHTVMREDKNAFFTACPNVHFHSGLSEDELVALYQSCDALFLPLQDATANNAILEAMACGTPVITTAVGSIGDYVDDSCGWLLPAGDAGAAFACLRAITEDRGLAAAKRAGARAKAETFAWPRMVTLLSEGYARLAATGRLAP